jgi:hypothetical protein
VTNNGSGVYGGSGFKNGIGGSSGNNTRVSGVSVTGCLNDGINLGESRSTVVDSCTVQTVSQNGIVASTVKSSVAVGCGLVGINGHEVSDSRGENNASGPGSFGIKAYTAQNCYGSAGGNGYAISANTAQNCYGISVSGPGINATTAQNCYGYSISGTGLNANSIAIGCVAYSSSGTGLSANIANSCLGTSVSGTAQSITYKYNMP